MIPAILPLYERAEIDFSHGEGVYLYATDGKRYLDLAAGYAAMSLGHCHPKMVQAIQSQAEKLWHLSNRYKIPGMQEYSRKLVDMTFGDTVFIANSGAEAVECMIKMTRRYFNSKDEKHRYRIITMSGAFHGRTLATSSAGSKEKMDGFGSPVDGFDRVAWDDLVALQGAITSSTAAVLIEPIQGEGGMRVANYEYMQELRNICNKFDLLLLVDEVQSGMGRSGNMFAYEMFGIKPDLMTLGKGLGSGFPVSACVATEEVGKAMKQGTHGSTFGGNPLAIAAAKVALDTISDPVFLMHVKSMGIYFKELLMQLKEEHSDKIQDITGTGLMLGIKLQPDISVDKFTKLCQEYGMLSVPAALNTLRITPPLIIDNHHCDEAIEKFKQVFKRMDSATYKIKDAFATVKKKIFTDD